MSSTPNLTHVTYDLVDDAIAIIKWNRPKAGNALNAKIMDDMLSAMRYAAADPKIKVIIQSGEGKFFTTGMDLRDNTSRSSDQGKGLGTDILREFVDLLIKCNKILIAAVNGPAAGFGTSSIALFDFVYAVPHAYFFTPFIKWGLCCEGCSSVTFAQIMGHQRAASLLLAGDRMSAQELHQAGLINKILPKETFMENVLTTARRIASYPAEALKFNKDLMMRSRRPALLEANAIECQGLQIMRQSDEAKEAIATFAVEQKQKRRGKSKAKL